MLKTIIRQSFRLQPILSISLRNRLHTLSNHQNVNQHNQVNNEIVYLLIYK
jgi:hypothetical protein